MGSDPTDLSRSPLASVSERIRDQIGSGGDKRTVLLVGAVGAGKTAAGLQLLSLLRSYGLRPGGILSPRVLKGEETIGYSIIDLATNTTHPFASLDPGEIRVGRFFISTQGLKLAERAIETALRACSVVFVDEIGRLELEGGGHAPSVRRILRSDAVPVFLVRDTFVEQAIELFEIADPMIFFVSQLREGEEDLPGGEKTFWQIIDSIPYPMLVTLCDDDGFPQSRPMHLIEHNLHTLWFATSRASRKVRQIRKNPKVSVLFVDSTRYNYAEFYGFARIVEDRERQKSLWRNDWEEDWPDGPSDPDYVLIRVEGLRGHYLRGSTGESGQIRLIASRNGVAGIDEDETERGGG
jgi:pyridoxamine 5'-phosphate oxidase